MGFTGLNIKGLLGASVITLSDNMTLQEKDRAFVLIVNTTAASKTLTLDLPDDACCIVINGGSHAFMLKNVSGDTGTNVATHGIFMVKASQTAKGTLIAPLSAGDGTNDDSDPTIA